MSPISITFDTPTNPRFQWFDSLKDLADEELDEIAVHCRSATAAIFTELSDRRNPWKDQTLEGYHDMLHKIANQINRKGLTNENELYLNNLHTYLAGPDDARNEIKVVRQFLWLVSRVIGWSYALLILCALGKHRLQKLDEDRRVKLVKHITQHRGSLFCPVLEDKAVRCNLHQIRMTIPPYIVMSIELLQMLKWTLHSQEAAKSGSATAAKTPPLMERLQYWILKGRTQSATLTANIVSAEIVLLRSQFHCTRDHTVKTYQDYRKENQRRRHRRGSGRDQKRGLYRGHAFPRPDHAPERNKLLIVILQHATQDHLRSRATASLRHHRQRRANSL